MGIEGLLKFLQPMRVKEHISSFRGQTAAIDIMSWIYKGCYRHTFELNQNIETNQFLYYILEMLQILSYYKIKPICVFDGRYLSKKSQTIDKRRKIKEENRQKGLELLQKGLEDEARKYFSRCIIIDERIIALTLSALHSKGIEFIVAPYQSDSQLAKLVHTGKADFVITQDSDLLVYNVKVALKLSTDGELDLIDLSTLDPREATTKYLQVFLTMAPLVRVEAAILAGSDYNNSIKGIGIKKAIKHLTEQGDINTVINNLRQHKAYSDKIPANYERVVLQSKLIFALATVFNPNTNNLEYLNPHLQQQLQPLDMTQEQLNGIVGPFYSYNDDIRKGKVHPRTLQPRQLNNIDLKNVLSLNLYSLNVLENQNKKRRREEVQRRKRIQEERANLPPDLTEIHWKKPNTKSKKAPPLPPIQLTEQQKKRLSQQRKAERVQRFEEFKNVLNRFMMDDFSESESSSEQSQQKSKEQTKKAIQNSEEVSQDDSNCSASVEECLMALNPYENPFLKK